MYTIENNIISQLNKKIINNFISHPMPQQPPGQPGQCPGKGLHCYFVAPIYNFRYF